MDTAQIYRALPYIGVLKKEVQVGMGLSEGEGRLEEVHMYVHVNPCMAFHFSYDDIYFGCLCKKCSLHWMDIPEGEAGKYQKGALLLFKIPVLLHTVVHKNCMNEESFRARHQHWCTEQSQINPQIASSSLCSHLEHSLVAMMYNWWMLWTFGSIEPYCPSKHPWL